MATSTDQLTREIGDTRGRMDQTLDDMGERAGPGRLKERMRGAMQNTRDTVMGVSGDAKDRVAETTGQASDAVREQSRGNPVAAGLVAFGAGLLAGSVFPESRAEHRMARDLQERTQGKARDELQKSAEEISDTVGDRAAEAKDTVVDESRRAKDDVSSDLRERAEEVKGHTRAAAEDVRRDVEEPPGSNPGR